VYSVRNHRQQFAHRDGNEPADAQPHPETSAATETPRPSYEDRRKQQIANGAQPISKRVGKRMRRVKPHEPCLQWVPCTKSSSENGVVPRLAKSQKADCFPTLEDAQAAEEKYFQEKGYHNEIAYCVVPCGAYHAKHRYSGYPQKESAPPERSAD
jgi:hypothetical protein